MSDTVIFLATALQNQNRRGSHTLVYQSDPNQCKFAVAIEEVLQLSNGWSLSIEPR